MTNTDVGEVDDCNTDVAEVDDCNTDVAEVDDCQGSSPCYVSRTPIPIPTHHRPTPILSTTYSVTRFVEGGLKRRQRQNKQQPEPQRWYC